MRDLLEKRKQEEGIQRGWWEEVKHNLCMWEFKNTLLKILAVDFRWAFMQILLFQGTDVVDITITSQVPFSSVWTNISKLDNC